jgi:hypothetical protein
MAKDKSTGFVVKLYQMVNGAPDDILSVSSFLVDEGVLRSAIALGAVRSPPEGKLWLIFRRGGPLFANL